MNKYDSKLFCGTKLGTLDVEIPKLRKIMNKENIKDDISYIEWVNTQIDKDIFLDIWYPYYGAPSNETYLHLNLFEMPFGKDTMTLAEMITFIGNIHFKNYENFLQQLGYEYKKPNFYTQYYIYANEK